MKKRLAGLYEAAVFRAPAVLVVFLLLLVAASAWFSTGFRMDASADALVLENDADLRYYRQIAEKYTSEDFLFIAYQPADGDFLSNQTLDEIASLKQQLLDAVPRLSDVFTLLDAPLIDSPRVGLREITQGVRTVRSPETDLELARKELTTSPAYGNNLVGADGEVTGLLLTFKRDEEFNRLLEARNSIRRIKLERPLTEEEQKRLLVASDIFTQYQIGFNRQRSEDIATIRQVMAPFREKATLFLGGASMIASDMIDFIRSDIVVFGIGVLVLLVVTLSIIFGQPRWILLPMLCCALTALVTTGLLGLLDWPVTVISSNYISLLLIITLSMTIHLTVRYRLLQAQSPDASHLELVRMTMREMAMPCFYMTITTIVAFGSLVVSGIRPVIDFGYMMMCGVAVAFVISFLVFPLGLLPLKAGKPESVHDRTEKLTLGIAEFTLRNGPLVLGLSLLMIVLTGFGVSRLEVENRFIDYFKSDTEIHQGMLLIDQKLGGTTPLEVIIDPDQAFLNGEHLQDDTEVSDEEALFGDDEEFEVAFDESEDDWLDDAYDEFEETSTEEANYWFNSHALERLEQVHDYLDSLPEVGKVMSLATAVKLIRTVNNDEPLGDFELAILRKNMPETLQQVLVKPYMAEDANQIRIVMRVIDSNKELRRGELIERIRQHLIDEFGFEEEQVHMTGVLVLYNNMLQSLFASQILTLGAVMAAIMLMFVVLFRSLFVSLVTIVPNALAAVSVLGLIGWLGIPLDLMTITIAAITVGIAVDDAIHYIYHFKHQLQINGFDYEAAMREAHASVGKAMYFTTLTIIMGFSILVLSNFIPSIYFGVLAGLAMLVALLCNLVLLPRLLILFRPFARGW